MATQKFQTAVAVLNVLFGYNPINHSHLNIKEIKNHLKINEDSKIVEASCKIISHPENPDELQMLHDPDIRQMINIINEMLREDPELVSILVYNNLMIEEQVGLDGLQIKLPSKNPGLFRKVSGLLARHAHMLATEIPSMFIAGGLSVFANSNLDPTSPITDPKRLPVLFVHGLKHNQSGWLVGQALLNRYDKDKKFGSFYSLSYDKILSNSWDKGIDDYVLIIEDKINEVLKVTGHKKIIMIGHSLGGILSSRYAETHDNCKLVFTIGSPFKGSHVASMLKEQKQNWGMKERIIDQQLVLDAPILNEIHKMAHDSDWNGRKVYFCIRSTTDQLVPKHNTFVTKDPRRTFTMESTGHVGLLFMPKVWQKVAEWLTEIYDENYF